MCIRDSSWPSTRSGAALKTFRPSGLRGSSPYTGDALPVRKACTGADVYKRQAQMSIKLNGINCFYGAHQALFDITLDCPQGETLVPLLYTSRCV